MKTFEGDLCFDAFEDHLYRELSKVQTVSENLILGKTFKISTIGIPIKIDNSTSVLLVAFQ